MFGQGFPAGMELAAEGTLVLLPLEGSIIVMFLLVHSQVGLGGVTL